MELMKKFFYQAQSLLSLHHGRQMEKGDMSLLKRNGKSFIQEIASGKENSIKKDTQIGSPSWSPDGKYLFNTYQDGNAEIYILRLRDQTLRG